ncbi:MAG: peptidoglycan DD-metalloendopeptidase family protein [Dehalococcoidia bacterium]|nr:peptidoglycan DD-metalloendopeptidase family protein [Dehalococcoidia bacterium]
MRRGWVALSLGRPYSGIVPLGAWRNILRLSASLFALLVTIAIAACGGDGNNAGDGVIIEPVTATPTPDAAANGSALHGFVFPIGGGCLPKGDQLMPNAARPYRNGIHEGVDLYGVDNCVAIAGGTPVLAARAGRVIRADLSYKDPTQAEINAYLANPNNESSLDQFRGRQVWVDHGGGIVTRYAHLQSVAPGLGVGTQVTSGQLIAYVGESGTPESVSNPGTEFHLHFEIRVGTGCVAPTALMTVNCSFLGKDLPAAEVRRLFVAAFTP